MRCSHSLLFIPCCSAIFLFDLFGQILPFWFQKFLISGFLNDCCMIIFQSSLVLFLHFAKCLQVILQLVSIIWPSQKSYMHMLVLSCCCFFNRCTGIYASISNTLHSKNFDEIPAKLLFLKKCFLKCWVRRPCEGPKKCDRLHMLPILELVWKILLN